MSYSRYGLGAIRAGVSTSPSARPTRRARPAQPLTQVPVVRAQVAKAARQQAAAAIVTTVKRATAPLPMMTRRAGPLAPRLQAAAPTQFLRPTGVSKASAVLQFNAPAETQTNKGADVPSSYSGGGGGGGGWGSGFSTAAIDDLTKDEEPTQFLRPTGVALPLKFSTYSTGMSGKKKILIVGGVAVAGAAAYYFLVHKKRKKTK